MNTLILIIIGILGVGVGRYVALHRMRNKKELTDKQKEEKSKRRRKTSCKTQRQR